MIDLDARYRHYRSRLRDFMKARNLTNDDVAEKLGVHPVTISKLRNGALSLDDEWRARFAESFDTEHDLLFGFEPLPAARPAEIRPPRRGRPRASRPPARQVRSELPMFGWAAGAVAGVETITSEPVEYVPCPPALSDIDEAYALRTRGESMVPRFFPGELVYVHPHKAVKSGDHVVVQTQRFEGSGTETWIKRFDADDEQSIYAAQYNPEGRVTFRKSNVLYVHRVLRPDELF